MQRQRGRLADQPVGGRQRCVGIRRERVPGRPRIGGRGRRGRRGSRTRPTWERRRASRHRAGIVRRHRSFAIAIADRRARCQARCPRTIRHGPWDVHVDRRPARELGFARRASDGLGYRDRAAVAARLQMQSDAAIVAEIRSDRIRMVTVRARLKKHCLRQPGSETCRNAPAPALPRTRNDEL